MSRRRINVRGVVWRDGKLLAVKHKDDDGSESPYWAVPGGGLDPEELLTDAVIREFIEETGVQTEVGKLLFVQQFPSKREKFTEEMELIFEIKDSPAFDAVDLSTTTHGHHELARIEFVDPKTVPIKPDFLAHIDIQSYIDGTEPVYIYQDLK